MSRNCSTTDQATLTFIIINDSNNNRCVILFLATHTVSLSEADCTRLFVNDLNTPGDETTFHVTSKRSEQRASLTTWRSTSLTTVTDCSKLTNEHTG